MAEKECLTADLSSVQKIKNRTPQLSFPKKDPVAYNNKKNRTVAIGAGRKDRTSSVHWRSVQSVMVRNGTCFTFQ